MTDHFCCQRCQNHGFALNGRLEKLDYFNAMKNIGFVFLFYCILTKSINKWDPKCKKGGSLEINEAHLSAWHSFWYAKIDPFEFDGAF